jgi:hypothetical protein
MPTASVSAVVKAPIEQVWEIVGDLAAQPKWNNVHVAFPKGVPSPVTVNAAFTQTITNMGLPNDIAWTVSEYEPQRVLELRGKGPMNVATRLRYEVKPLAEGTSVTIENEFNSPLIKLIAGRLKKGAEADMKSSLRQLAALLE